MTCFDPDDLRADPSVRAARRVRRKNPQAQPAHEAAAGCPSGPPAGAPVPWSTARPRVSGNIARTASRMLVKPHPAPEESPMREISLIAATAVITALITAWSMHTVGTGYAGQHHGSVDLDEHHANDAGCQEPSRAKLRRALGDTRGPAQVPPWRGPAAHEDQLVHGRASRRSDGALTARWSGKPGKNRKTSTTFDDRHEKARRLGSLHPLPHRERPSTEVRS